MGCQSMGCRRSSEDREGLNFHLRMMVQMMPAAPMDPPMAMRMIIVLRCNLVTEPDEAAAAVDDGDVVELIVVTGLTLDNTVWELDVVGVD